MGKLSVAAYRLTALLEEGKIRNAWETVDAVADHLKIARGTFTNYSNGVVRDEEIIDNVAERVRGLLAQKLDNKMESVDPKIDALRTLYLQGIRNGKWRKIYHCAERCAMDGGSLSRYLHNRWKDSARAQAYLDDVLLRMRKRAGKIEIHERKEPSTDDSPTPADSHAAFVLNAGNIRLHQAFADPRTVKDTAELLTLLAEELERRFRILKALDEDGRAIVLKKLIRPIDQLYEAIEASFDVTESQAAKHLASKGKPIL